MHRADRKRLIRRVVSTFVVENATQLSEVLSREYQVDIDPLQVIADMRLIPILKSDGRLWTRRDLRSYRRAKHRKPGDQR